MFSKQTNKKHNFCFKQKTKIFFQKKFLFEEKISYFQTTNMFMFFLLKLNPRSLPHDGSEGKG